MQLTEKQEKKIKEATAEMDWLRREDDFEQAHVTADNILCDVLVLLGQGELVEKFREVGKWYA